ncbi:hypothetical protein [Mesorhizobium sp. KR1-2]|uniref:hypothetical protein n=1 Tax=Mesorhizobium sp. KR1-2 TaxID=3156609 RepID=UPI0032B60F44
MSFSGIVWRHSLPARKHPDTQIPRMVASEGHAFKLYQRTTMSRVEEQRAKGSYGRDFAQVYVRTDRKAAKAAASIDEADKTKPCRPKATFFRT